MDLHGSPKGCCEAFLLRLSRDLSVVFGRWSFHVGREVKGSKVDATEQLVRHLSPGPHRSVGRSDGRSLWVL